MSDKFKVVLGEKTTYVGTDVPNDNHGFWDVVRLTCGVQGGMDVDGDRKVDIIDCDWSNKKIVRDPKFRETAKILFRDQFGKGLADTYEEVATPEELAFVQKKWDEGWALAQKRWGEIHTAFKKGLITITADDTLGTIKYRFDTTFQVLGKRREVSADVATNVGIVSADKLRGEGLPITGFNSNDRDLDLTVSDPKLVKQIQPELDKAVARGHENIERFHGRRVSAMTEEQTEKEPWWKRW